MAALSKRIEYLDGPHLRKEAVVDEDESIFVGELNNNSFHNQDYVNSSRRNQVGMHYGMMRMKT